MELSCQKLFGGGHPLCHRRFQFMGMLFWRAEVPPGLAAVALYLVGGLLFLLPVTGVWYIVFLSQFLIYEQMDASFRIEELYSEREEQPERKHQRA